MNTAINTYNESQSNDENTIFNKLFAIIDSELTQADSNIWHAHSVWFVDGNPIVGYSKQK